MMSDFPAFKEIQVLYHSLDNTLKLCLLCFSAFPDNSIINKRALTYWWIGEGFIESVGTRDETAEQTAEEYFAKLQKKGFIEPVYRKRYPIIHQYKIHPFVRHMVVRLAQRPLFFDIDIDGNFLPDRAKSRRACLVRIEEGSSQNELRYCSDLKHLETLFNLNEPYLNLQDYWFSKLKDVKVLHLGRWQSSTKHHIEVGNTDFLKSLTTMKRLRSLNLQGISRISVLPVSFSNLTEMRVLDLRACHNLQKLPHGMGKLRYLTHLDISECYLIGHMPIELASLSQLQVLKGFVVSESERTEDGCGLSQLSQLTNLRKLSLRISGEAIATRDELYNNLPCFTTLVSLTIAWVGIPSPTSQKPPPLLKRLVTMQRPPQSSKLSHRGYASGAQTQSDRRSGENLKKLDLRCFPWTQIKDFMNPTKLTGLEKLYIRGGELCDLKMSPPWKVEYLRLKYLCKLSMNWGILQASFPHLTYLEKVSCPKLSLFPCDGRGVWVKKISDSNVA